MFCHNCGHRNPEGANFCGACGATLQPEQSKEATVSFVPEAADQPTGDISLPLDELEDGRAILVVKKGPDAGTKFVLDKDTITCGRHEGSDIFLDDVTVSRKHAEISRDQHGYKLHDLGSLNGTFLNRARVDVSPLSNGDEIQIGKFKLAFFSEAVSS